VRAPDQDVRDRIVSARGVNLAVEAGAGTGKTTLLVHRVLSRLEGGVPLPRLAIITFTRKAAAELTGRIRKRLVERKRDGEGWAARGLEDYDLAVIGTTDSFCRTILSEFPFEAGVPPGFGVADEVAQVALQDEAWRDFLASSGDDARDLLTALREAGISSDTLRQVADAILSNRDLPVAVAPPPDLPDLAGVLGGSLGEALSLRSLCRDPSDRLRRHLDDLEEELALARSVGGAAGERALLRRRRERRRYTNRRHGRQDAWGGKENVERVRRALEDVESTVDDFLEKRGLHLTAAYARWIEGYRREYEARKRERGLLDFRDLGLATRDLLRREPRVRRIVAGRFDEILMDEVQDTDPLQMEIALLLSTADGDSPDPLEAALVPGRLFLVGDPKQSIYRFRRADIELYERVRAHVASSGVAGGVEANFRARPEILRFVNHVFAGWMEPPPGESWQARYVDLVPGREAAEPPGDPAVTLLLPDPAREAEILARTGSPRLRADGRAELERDAVARAVRRVLGLDGSGPPLPVVDPGTGRERPAEPGDVAVLVRKIAWGDRLLETLRRAGVPAAVSAGRRFYAKEEIRTLLALLEAVIDPEDRLARFAALRSPAFGIRDDDLVLHFLEEAEEGSAEAGAVVDAETRLRKLAEEARSLPVPDFLERLTEETSLLPVFGFRPDGRGRVESIRLLLEAADSLVDAGFDTLPSFVRWLRGQAAASRTGGPGEEESGTESAVQILTVHKAKGLEFPVVILADLGSGAVTDRRLVTDRAANRIDFRLSAAERVMTSGFEAAARSEARRQAAEDVRLLYVAMTRARDRLILSWAASDRGYFARAGDEPSVLESRVGCTAGAAPPEGSGLGRWEAGRWPPLAIGGRLHALRLDSPPPPAGPTPEDAFEPLPRARRRRPILRATEIGARSKATPAGRPPDEVPASPGPRPVSERGTPLPDNVFGTLVHKFLEMWSPSSGQTAEDGLREAASAVGLDPGAIPLEGGLVRTVDRILGDPALAPIRAGLSAGSEEGTTARRVLREVPFLLPAGVGLVSGTLDVLLEEADGRLVVIDYKTGRGGGLPADRAKERFRTQAGLYALAVTRQTGRPVEEVRFLFLDRDPVEVGSFRPDQEFLEEARRRID
jgi:ATP-dependent helicase/nuclease subunit A